MLTLSSFEASTEEGSRGASPPLGEAIEMETCGARTSYGWANSGCERLDSEGSRQRRRN